MKTHRLVLTCLVLLSVDTFGQQPGVNVNVLPSYPSGVFVDPRGSVVYDGALPPSLSSTDPLRGDGYKQRQDEPDIAASTYNPDHILAVFNDYRTVAIPNDQGLPGSSASAWVGLARSYDRGRTWAGALVPGFPQDTSTVGLNSPLHGMQAGSDPGIATAPNGQFYISGLYFTPSANSKIAVVHYRDVPDTDGGDTIRYQSTAIVDTGSASSSGNFNDKPAITADIARGTTNPSVCGPVY